MFPGEEKERKKILVRARRPLVVVEAATCYCGGCDIHVPKREICVVVPEAVAVCLTGNAAVQHVACFSFVYACVSLFACNSAVTGADACVCVCAYQDVLFASTECMT